AAIVVGRAAHETVGLASRLRLGHELGGSRAFHDQPGACGRGRHIGRVLLGSTGAGAQRQRSGGQGRPRHVSSKFFNRSNAPSGLRFPRRPLYRRKAEEILMKLFDLSGRVAVVTGGNGGIGLGMAKGMAAAGATIVVAGRDAAKNSAAVKELKNAG